MAKVKPPKEIYDQWTPEQREEYNDTYVEPAKKKSEERRNDMVQVGASGPILDVNDPNNHDTSVERQNRMALADAGHENPGDIDGTSAFKLSLITHTGNDPRYDSRRRGEYERAEHDWHEALKEVNDVTIDDKESEGLPFQVKHYYEQDLLNAIDDCEKGIDSLNERLLQKQQELENTWLDCNKKVLQQDIESIERAIKKLEHDLAFNKKCLENSFPPPPPPPPPPPMPLTIYYAKAGDKITCPFAMGGTAALMVNPSRKVFLEKKPMANIMDFQPMSCIPSFGMCSTLSNPAVASATSAAMGVLTPQPCVPVVTAPWVGAKPDVLVEGAPALLTNGQATCAWGGMISFIPI